MRTKADIRAEQILLAAATSFARKGFHQTTMDDIAREANVSAGLIYRHYASKEQLIAALVDGYERQARERLAQQGQANAALASMLAALFAPQGAPADVRTEGVLLVEVLAEALRNPRIAALLQQSDGALADQLTASISAAQARGEVDQALSPAIATQLLLALRDGLLLRMALATDQELVESAPFQTALRTLYTRFVGLKADA